MERENKELKTQMNRVSDDDDDEDQSDDSDRIVKRMGYFVSNGQANGLPVFLTKSGEYVYLSSNGRIKSIEKSIIEEAFKKLPKIFDE